MDRWYWCDPSLLSGETLQTTQNGIRLYDGDKKTGFDDGILSLTSHRLPWRHHSKTSSLGLHISSIVLVEEESGGFTSSPKLAVHLTPSSPSKPVGPVALSSHSYIKLSFRHGGLHSFMSSLQKALADRGWEKTVVQSKPAGATTASGRPVRAGILGIEREILAKNKETNKNISRAFQDLNQLMSLARDMVTVSKMISSKIKEHTGEISADETTQFRSYLLSLGIDDPVTKEAYGSTTEYHRELAREVAGALEGPVKEAGGTMLLSEAFCRINRARGLTLLSPDDMLNACSVMSSLQLSLRLHTFESGVQVVQLSSLGSDALVEETAEFVNDHQSTGISAGELARTVGISVMLAHERLIQVEKAAKSVRDESPNGLRFYPNLFFNPPL